LQGVVAQVATGAYFTCARLMDGTLKCWGSNNAGQCSQPTSMADVLAPMVVAGLPNATIDVGAGSNHVCAITSDRSVLCWGQGTSGQLGNGMTTNRVVPSGVVGLP